MASRMDKYHSPEDKKINTSRYSKNEQLYEQLYTNRVITEFTNTKFDNVVDLSTLSTDKTVNRREQYKKDKYLSQTNTIPKVDSYQYLDPLKEKEPDLAEKNYNINDILEEARKNRNIEDESEKRKRLRNVEYSILSDLSKEKLKEYHDNKKQKLTKEEEENLEDLIHTITSNSLRKKIDDELLSELLPTKELDTIISEELISSEDNDNDNREDGIDDSFYTKSMDLSTEDLELEEDRSFLEDKKMGIIPKILITLFVLAIIGIIIYIIYHFI